MCHRYRDTVRLGNPGSHAEAVQRPGASRQIRRIQRDCRSRPSRRPGPPTVLPRPLTAEITPAGRHPASAMPPCSGSRSCSPSRTASSATPPPKPPPSPTASTTTHGAASAASSRDLHSNAIENTQRPTKLALRNSLFAGSEDAIDIRASASTLITTCRFNCVDPEARVTHALIEIRDGCNGVQRLLPWHPLPADDGQRCLAICGTRFTPPATDAETA